MLSGDSVINLVHHSEACVQTHLRAGGVARAISSETPVTPEVCPRGCPCRRFWRKQKSERKEEGT